MDTSETDGLVDRVEAVPQKQRKQRADKGSRRQAPKTENGLMSVRFEIEPEDSFALHRWLVEQGYEDAAVALTQQSVKHFDKSRLAED